MLSDIVDGKLYLEYGPTNLVVDVFCEDRERIYGFIGKNLVKILAELSSEIKQLRLKTNKDRKFESKVAKIMNNSTQIFLPRFITPFASVAGAVAEILLEETLAKFKLKKIYINNGGDAAIYLKKNENLKFLIADSNNLILTLPGENEKLGIATSGWKGRSLSMGIADSVTTIGHSSSIADAAATIIANETNIENHKNIKKQKANKIDEHSDLKEMFVTTSVGELTNNEIKMALKKGKLIAENFINKKYIFSALINVKEYYIYVGKKFHIKSIKKKLIL